MSRQKPHSAPRMIAQTGRILLAGAMTLFVLSSAARASEQRPTYSQLMGCANKALEDHDFAQARSFFQAAKEDAEKRGAKLQSAAAVEGLADSYGGRGEWNWKEAEPYYRAALKLASQAIGEYDERLVHYLENSANAHQRIADYDIATDEVTREIEILKRSQPGSALLGTRYSYRAMIAADNGRYAEAHKDHKLAQDTFAKLTPPDLNWIAMDCQNESVTYEKQGKYHLAESLIQKSLKLRKRPGADPDSVYLPTKRLAEFCYGQSRITEARTAYQEAYNIWSKTKDGATHPYTAYALQGMACIDIRDGNFAQAQQELDRVLQILKKEHGPDHFIVGKCLSLLAQCKEGQGENAEALSLYSKALELHEKSLPEDHPSTCAALVNLADFYQRSSQMDQALPRFCKAISLYEHRLGKLHPALIPALRSAAGIEFAQANYDAAERDLRRAAHLQQLSLREGQRSINNRLKEIALKAHKTFIDDLAEFCCREIELTPNTCAVANEIRTGRYDNVAKMAQQRLLTLPSKADPHERLHLLYLAGFAHYKLNKPTELAEVGKRLQEFRGRAGADEKYLVSLALLQAQQDPTYCVFSVLSGAINDPSADPLSEALAKTEVGVDFNLLGANGDSWLKAGCDALHKHAQQPGKPVSVLISDALSTAGYCQSATDGQSKDAQSNIDGAVAILRQSTEVATCKKLLRLASAERLMGQFGKASAIASVALSKAIAIGDVAECRIEQAKIASEHEDFTKAKIFAYQALEKGKLLQTTNPEAYADTLDVTAQVFLASNDVVNEKEGVDNVTKALELCRKSVAIRQKKRPTLPYLLSLVDLATIEGEANHLALAKSAFEKAKNLLAQPEFADQQIVLGAVDSGLGNISLRQAKYSEAINRYNEALEIHVADHSSQGILDASADLNALAIVNSKLNKDDDARNCALNAAAMLDKYIIQVFPQLSFAEQCSFADQTTDELDFLLTYCTSPKSLPTSFKYLVHWQGLLLDFIRKRKLESQLANDPRFAETIRTLRARESERAQLLQLNVRDKDASASLNAKVDTLNNEIEGLEKDYATKLASSGIANSTPNGDLSKCQKLLKPSEAFIDIVAYKEPASGEQHYGCFAIDAAQPPQFWSLNYSSVNNAIKDWRDAVLDLPYAARKAAGTFAHPKQAKRGSQATANRGLVQETAVLHKQKMKLAQAFLQQEVWLGMTSRFPTAKKFWVCTDAELTTFPLSALYIPSDSKMESSVQVSEVDSPREWISLLADGFESKTVAKPSTEILAAGAIDYKQTATNLPFTASELKGIKPDLDRFGHVTILKDAEASRATVLALLPKVRIAHFATHGFYADPEQGPGQSRGSRERKSRTFRADDINPAALSRNPLAASGIILAPVPVRNSFEKSRLTAADLVGINLQSCDMVVLSACETGRGKTIGGQGVVGLRMALIGAGAKSALVSLWSVNDQSTCELMKAFYHYLASEKYSRSEALSHAQQQVRRLKAEWRDNPYYWAGWKLAGNGF